LLKFRPNPTKFAQKVLLGDVVASPAPSPMALYLHFKYKLSVKGLIFDELFGETE